MKYPERNSHKICCLCHGTILSKKKKHRARAAVAFSLIQKYLLQNNLTVQITNDDLICDTCHSKFRHGRQLPNLIKCKKIKFCDRCDPPVNPPGIEDEEYDSSEARSQGSESGWSGTTEESENSDDWQNVRRPNTPELFDCPGTTFSANTFDTSQLSDSAPHSSMSDRMEEFWNLDDECENEFEPSPLSSSSSIGFETLVVKDGPPQSMKQRSIFMELPTINSTSESRCFICPPGSGVGTRRVVPRKAAAELFLARKILIPREKVRCCGSHLLPNDFFKEDALRRVQASKVGVETSSAEISKFLLEIASVAEERSRGLDFGPNSRLSSNDFEMLTGLSHYHFTRLFSEISDDLRNTCNRTAENALAIFLMKLRLNLPQTVIAILFGIKNNRPQATVSEIFHRVATLLNEKFVPKYLGYSHLSRDECIKSHSSVLALKLCEATPGSIIVILDGTYLYIEKPSDQVDQKKTYSLHKHRNLLKPMMVILTDGYILEADGLYYADNKNNDARILIKMINRKDNGIMSFLKPGDRAILDRGFRDSIDACSKENLIILMPQLLKRKQKSFTTMEGNESRRVTFLRWVVEAVNGRVKNKFRFFASTIPVTYAPMLNNLFRISCAICNAFCPPIIEHNEDDIAKANRILGLLSTDNELKKLIETHKLASKRTCWSAELATTVKNFPVLTIDDLQWITIGSFQLEMAKYYTRRHIKGNNYGGYEIFLHKTIQNLLYARFASRFSSRPHQVFIQYDPTINGPGSILQWYCSCQAGLRTLGCCSHIASILWYMGHAKNQTKDAVGNSSIVGHILDAQVLVDNSNDIATLGSDSEFNFENPDDYDDESDAEPDSCDSSDSSAVGDKSEDQSFSSVDIDVDSLDNDNESELLW